MNSLSWLIYLAGVVSSIGVIAAFVAFVAFVTFFVGIIFYFQHPDDDEYDKPKRASGVSMMKRSAIAFTVCSLLMVVLPGRDTIYAIAASEMGEELLDSETGSKAVRALDAWLDRQIDPPEEPAD
jgi:amino acid permease